VLGTGTALSDPEIALHVTRLMAQLETDLGAAQATLAELRGGIAEAPGDAGAECGREDRPVRD
jgi:hypothetical protein